MEDGMVGYRKTISKTALLATCAILSLSAAKAFPQSWWNAEWQCRRIVEVAPPSEKRPGTEAAFVSFPTGGHLQPEGRDIRVLAGDRLLGHQVVFVGPGDRVSLLFQYVPGRREYYIYYGNPTCDPLDVEWKPQRGLLLETRPYTGGNCRNWKEMQATLKRAGPPFKIGFVDSIFHGHNPFGRSNSFVSKYSGWLHIANTEKFDIAISSASASFLFLDGKMFLQWPGWHGPIGRGRFHKTVNLKAGLHPMEYYHIQGNAKPFMVAVWRRPEEKRYKKIPAAAFLPPLQAAVRSFRLRDDYSVPDFDWENVSETSAGGQGVITMKFTDRPYLKTSLSRKRLWDFGDGVTSVRMNPIHTYLASGTYTVTLSYPQKKNQTLCRQIVVVGRDWARQTTLEPEPLGEVVPRIRDYPLDQLDGRSVLGALLLYRELAGESEWKARAEKAMFEIAAAISRRADTILEADLCEAALILGKVWRESAKSSNPNKALELYRLAEAEVDSKELKAKLALSVGDTIYYDLNKPVLARAEYERVVNQYGDAKEHVRLAFLRLGDIARDLGNAGKARDAYRESLALQGNLKAERQAIGVAMRALETEDLLRRGLLDEAEEKLHQWQWQDPEEKMRGQWSVLRMRLALKREDMAAVEKEAGVFLRINPESQYAPEALFLLSEVYRMQDNFGEARNVLMRLQKEYPGSPFSGQAQEKLEDLSSKRKR